MEFVDLLAVDDSLRRAAGPLLLRQRSVLRDLNLDDESTLRALVASDFARVTLLLLRSARSLADLTRLPLEWTEVFRAVGDDPGREAVRALVSNIWKVRGEAEAQQLRPLFEDTLSATSTELERFARRVLRAASIDEVFAGD